MNVFVIAAGTLTAGACIFAYMRWKSGARERFIEDYRFPVGLLDKLAVKQPHLTREHRSLVGRGLKQFFLAHAKSGKFVSMPSQVADELWHEFILYTKAYEHFCCKAFGRFMHHTPAVVLGKRHQNNEGLRRTWWYSCKQEGINPHTPARLPLLFALDTQLGIANGFIYHPQCKQLQQATDGGTIYCGGEFSSPSYDGSTTGFGDSSTVGEFSAGGGDISSSSDSGGGGDSGCGGGCGGGGD